MSETIKSPDQEWSVMSFQEFIGDDSYSVPNHNNFELYFDSGFTGDLYREKEHYVRFEKDHPDIAKFLYEKMQGELSLLEEGELNKIKLGLYEAYKIMRSYGVSDIELFS